MHVVKCVYCGAKFDRDKEEYCVISAKRYSHAACMLREVEKNPNYVKKEIIDPTINVVCIYCKQPMTKKDEDCIMVSNGKYAHAKCAEIESQREKTDKEKLEEYIKALFQVDYVNPRIQKQIQKPLDNSEYEKAGNFRDTA